MIPLIDADNYYVTMCGRVFARCRTHYFKSNRYPNGVYRVLKQQELKPRISKSTGYCMVGYTDNSGVRKVALIHRLVAKAYIPNPEDKKEVNHKDLDKTNNCVSNLEWTTRYENLKHSWNNNRKRIGSTNGASILGEEDVLLIDKLLRENYSQTEISRMFEVSNHAVHRIAKGYNWGWLTGRKVGEECVRS